MNDRRRWWVAGAVALLLVGLGSRRAVLGDWTGALDRLADASPAVREGAVQALADQGGAVVAALVTRLGSEGSPLVQTGIAQALIRIGLAEADMGMLRPLLYSPAPATRRITLGLVAATKPSALVSDLEGITRNTTELAELRAVAAMALGSTGSQPRALLRDAVLDGRDRPAARARLLLGLALTGEQGVGDVVELAVGEKVPEELRMAAWQALADPRVGATGALVELLGSKGAGVRCRAVAALHRRGDHQDTDVASALTERTGDDDAGVRVAALTAVADSKHVAEAASAISGRLSDSDARVRALAARVVGRVIGDTSSKVAEVLTALLEDGVFVVRHEAALSLAALGSSSGHVAMLADAKSTDPVVSATATAALTTITTLLQTTGAK